MVLEEHKLKRTDKRPVTEMYLAGNKLPYLKLRRRAHCSSVQQSVLQYIVVQRCLVHCIL